MAPEGQAFDPYYRLLSISPRQRRNGALDHFTLLGLAFDERDPVIIENAADQRMQHLRSFRLSSEFAKPAEALLTEVSRARLVLLDEQRRTAYVRELAAAMSPVSASQPWPAAQPTALPIAQPLPQPYAQPRPMPSAQPLPSPVVQPAPLQIAPRPSGGKSASAQRPAGKPPLRLLAEIVGGGLAGIVLAALLVQFMFGVDLFGLNPPPPQGRPVASKSGSRGSKGATKPGPETSGVTKLPSSSDSAFNAKMSITPNPADPTTQAPGTPATAQDAEPSDTAASPPVVSTPSVEPSPPGPVPLSVTANKLAVPSVEERTRAALEIENVFGKAADAKTPEEKSLLARKMYQAALETSDTTMRFTLLQGAMQLFGKSGEIKSSLSMLDALAAQYEVEPLKVKLATLPDYAEAATTDAELRLLGETAAVVMQQAVVHDQIDGALVFVESLRGSERLQTDPAIAAALDDARKSLKVKKLQWDKFAAAQATLVASPDDGEANLAVGLWFCSQKRDWPRALSHFAKAGDQAIQAAAQADLASPVKSTEQVAVADAWYDLGQGQLKPGESPIAPPSIYLQRARHWYRLALPAADGLERARVAKRISEIAPAWQAAIPRSAAQFEGHSYAVLTKGMSWHQAYLVCEGLGGHLARIESADENAFVTGLAQAGGQEWYWVDGSDEVKEGEWRFSDGRKVAYASWGPRQPQGGGENHVTFGRDGTWHDYNNGQGIRPICEWDASLEAPGIAELIDDVAPRVDEIREQLLTRFSADEGGSKTRIPKDAVRFQGHRYLVAKEKVTWHMARHSCAEVGGHLVRIESKEEMQFVLGLTKKNPSTFRYWVDLTNEYVEPGWRQSNGKLIARVTFVNGNGGGDCVAVGTDGTYDDHWGGDRRLFVCEWDE